MSPRTLTSRVLAITALVAAASSAMSPLAKAESNGGRGGGYVMLCYKDVALRDQIAELLAKDTGRIGTVDAPTFDRDLHLNRKDLSSPPVVVDYYEVMTRNFRELKDLAWREPEMNEHSVQDAYERVRDVVYKQLCEETSRNPLRCGKAESAPATTPGDGFWDLFDRHRTTIKEWIPRESMVARVGDATFRISIPRNCTYVQVASFDDENHKVYFDKRIYRWLDLDNRATLWAHEDTTHFYRAGRRQAAKTWAGVVAWVAEEQGLSSPGRTAKRMYANTVLPYWINLAEAVEPETIPGAPVARGAGDSINTDVAREFVEHLLTHSTRYDYQFRLTNGTYRDSEFRRLATQVSLSVEFADEGSKWGTYVVNRYSRQKIAYLEDNHLFELPVSAAKMRKADYEASF